MLLNLSFPRAFDLLALIAACQGTILTSRRELPNTETALEPIPLINRALPNAPNGYVPQVQDCPLPRPRIRSAASGLSIGETSWLEMRRSNIVNPMRDLLGRLNMTGFDAKGYIANHAYNATAMPNVALAFSGGGYRAMLNGAGALQAFDEREVGGKDPGHLGGLLQASTYVAGLSGGSWLVGSVFVNNFTKVHDLQNSSVWQLNNSIFEGPATGGFQLLDIAEYLNDVADAVGEKRDAGYNVSVTDYWGRALSYQLVNASEGGPSYTWSSIAKLENFAEGQIPMPIVIADERAPGELLIPGNATVYEFNPWEMGTFDPTTYGFVPLEYLGSSFSRGVLQNKSECVRGFDNVGFVLATSSSLFNQFLLQVNNTDIPKIAKKFIIDILNEIGRDNNDIAEYTPNPFHEYHDSQSETLTLVDGGEDLENIPLHPLVQPVRAVDVIFAVDSSADTNYAWPNGTSLVATYQRSLDADISNGTSFPAVPDQNTFVNLGLNSRPTFFGCNVSNTTSVTPLIVYLPNSPYVYRSNVSTFNETFTLGERDTIITNGYAVATMGNATIDPMWPTCVGCSILQRSLLRTGTQIPDACTACFNKYCWNGTVNSTQPAEYDPEYSIGAILPEIPNRSGASLMDRQGSLATVSSALVVTVLMMVC